MKICESESIAGETMNGSGSSRLKGASGTTPPLMGSPQLLKRGRIGGRKGDRGRMGIAQEIVSC